MIDALQRLSIDYHFEEEIQETLSSQHGRIKAYNGRDCNLFDASLRFRLLRQEGYPVLSDVFNLFTDDEGRFRLHFGKDIRGMMSLYEAAQFGVQGEEILEEASAFARAQLCASVAEHGDIQNGLSKMVLDTIEHPYHKTIPRFMTKHNIKTFYYGSINSGLIEDLAKEDFVIVRSLYRTEISQISKWWRDLGLSEELKLARNQPVKWYMWSVATFADPRHSNQRIELTKAYITHLPDR
ncbi:hypothetical protein Sjap_003420 [Stephania japonica]|uniref:Uncharacterized protein n=1 Tax=Stephania japonica TaxID=461633 RepID=A0AAP0KRC8_9MAGN